MNKQEQIKHHQAEISRLQSELDLESEIDLIDWLKKNKDCYSLDIESWDLNPEEPKLYHDRIMVLKKEGCSSHFEALDERFNSDREYYWNKCIFKDKYIEVCFCMDDGAYHIEFDKSDTCPRGINITQYVEEFIRNHLKPLTYDRLHAIIQDYRQSLDILLKLQNDRLW